MGVNNTQKVVELDIKSNDSLSLGRELVNRDLSTQSVHCFYYSVLQMMKYKLAHCSQNPIDYDKQKENADYYKSSTHDWLFSEIYNRLNLKGKMKKIFDENFKSLKSDRVGADYNTRFFSQEEGTECREKAEKLLADLRSIR